VSERVLEALALQRAMVAARRSWAALELSAALVRLVAAMPQHEADAYRAAWEQERAARLRAWAIEAREQARAA
jgi:hypothetical protein